MSRASRLLSLLSLSLCFAFPAGAQRTYTVRPPTLQGDAAAIRAFVDEARAPARFTFDGPAFDARRARGKSAVLVTPDAHTPSARARIASLRRALAGERVKLAVREVPPESEPLVRAFQRIARERPAAVALVGYTGRTMGDKPVIFTQRGIGFVRLRMGADRPDPSGVGPDLERAGALLGLWPLVDGDREGILITSGVPSVRYPERPPAQTNAGRGARMLAGWGDAKVRFHLSAGRVYRNLEPAEWARELGTVGRQVQAQAKPGSGYLLLTEREMVPVALAELERWKEPAPRLIAYGANRAMLQAIARGSALKAAVGVPDAWVGYAYADQILRQLSGVPQVQDEKIPLRLFDGTNVQTLNVRGPEERWYGDVDFVAAYRRIWSGRPAR